MLCRYKKEPSAILYHVHSARSISTLMFLLVSSMEGETVLASAHVSILKAPLCQSTASKKPQA